MALQIPASIPFHAKRGILSHDYFSLPPEARFSDPPFLVNPYRSLLLPLPGFLGNFYACFGLHPSFLPSTT